MSARVHHVQVHHSLTPAWEPAQLKIQSAWAVSDLSSGLHDLRGRMTSLTSLKVSEASLSSSSKFIWANARWD